MASFDFSKLKGKTRRELPKDPRDIFRRRPSGTSKIKEMWQGQAYALDEWYKNPDRSSLISMYTGAGKTLVGVLIAQSYVNQGYGNVLYACPTIDLIHQTVSEARSIGLNPTTYYNNSFSDSEFERGRAFCVTTYHALLTTRTKFRGQFSPNAIVFDDAHVGERLVREAFTLSFTKSQHPELFHQLAREIASAFHDAGVLYNFQAVMAEDGAGIQLAPPVEVLKRSDRFDEILKNGIATSDRSNTLSYDYIRGRVGLCAITVSKNRIEITPPFLPSLHMRPLEDNGIPRVFLSATIHSKGDIIRAFGRSTHVIEPQVDAGRGERVFLFGSALENSLKTREDYKDIISQHKVLIAVPSKSKAKAWEIIAPPPDSDSDFTQQLNDFRDADKGAFVLVGRYDGIDLPDEQCRIMLVDGLPVGTTQLERFAFDSLRLDRSFMSTIATRITQLFGRINRGKNDFGIYFIFDKNFENWMRNPRNMSNFPKILQEQILLSEVFSETTSNQDTKSILGIINQIIDRDAGWIDFYNSINDQDLDDELITERAAENKIDDKYAKKESSFILKLWQGDPRGAIEALEPEDDELAIINPRLYGWYSVWLGIANYQLGATDAAQDWFEEAKKKLGARLTLPRRPIFHEYSLQPEKTFFEAGLRQYLMLEQPKMIKQIMSLQDKVAKAFLPEDHKAAEEGIRQFGEAMGFDAQRPCTDVGTGPDGIWIDHHTKGLIAFELKNEKGESSEISKSDIGQCHDHLEWVKSKYPDYRHLGLIIYTQAKKISDQANPTSDMHLVDFAAMKKLFGEFNSTISDLSQLTPVERFATANQIGENPNWSIDGIFARLVGNEP